RVIVQEVSKTPDVIFVRAIQPGTGTVLVSSNENEVGLVFESIPPVTAEPVVRNGTWQEEEVLEIFMRASASENLWMAVSLASIKRGALMHALFVGGSVFVSVFVLLGILYMLIQKMILAPVLLLERSLRKVGGDDLSVRLPEGPKNEIGSVFRSFNIMTESVQKARERDAAVSKMKSEFVTIAAHQLRTPLSGSRWALQELLREDAEKLTDTQRRYLKQTHEANERMVALVNDLLDVTQIEEGKYIHKPAPARMEEIVRSTVTSQKNAAEQHGIILTFREPKQPLPEVLVDKVRIGVVVENLVDNALSYTQDGGSVIVRLAYREAAGVVEVSVEDTGIGIP
ncbi:MAG: HAMP domain-containing sensor histidine kinase, partial [bacterium]|nr:HAMP domain-containing sensor histidine kinase [bacterium]